VDGKVNWILLFMAIFYQQQINENTRLGVWKIEEQESFFSQKVSIKKDVSHPHKRLQHLAGRYLLTWLFPEFPLGEVLIADTRKPFLPNEAFHFSISHCGDFAAAIASTVNRVGVDVELVTAKVARIRHKFLNDFEWQLSNDITNIYSEDEQLTALWSAKESIFKWYSLGEMDFRRHMFLTGKIQFANEWMEMPFDFQKDQPIPLKVQARIFESLVLAYVVS
jgi:4'-phosphopantetheinyl transferase EntD